MKKEDILQKVKEINKKYKDIGFKIVVLFGSYARGEEDAFSDIDLAYDINHKIFFKDNAFKKLLKIEDIKKELEKSFHKKVDLIPYKYINKKLEKSIESDKVLIDEK
jgi:predicted nucleotidyltransferase